MQSLLGNIAGECLGLRGPKSVRSGNGHWAATNCAALPGVIAGQ